MSRSNATESDDGVLSVNSPLSNDNSGGSCNESVVLKKGPWTCGEDAILVDYVKKHGEGNWNAVQRNTGLARCGKSCRLRWANHLRPNLKKGAFTQEEEQLIVELHAKMGNKWARMASHLPGRTDNEIKNYWNTRIKRRQRAGMPLYPDELYLHPVPENQQPLTPPGIYIRNSSCHGPSDIISESYNIQHHPEYGTSPSLPKSIGFSSPQFYSYPTQILGAPKRVRGLDETISLHKGGDANAAPPFVRTQTEDSMSLNFGMMFPRDLDHKRKLLPYGVNQDGYFVPNDIFSASKHLPGAQKLELPSLQYQETSSGFWNLESKSPGSLIDGTQSETRRPHGHFRRCSGLLEDLLYEAKALNKSENHGDVTESSALKTCSTEFNGYLDPSSPHGNSNGSNFNACSLTGHVGRSSQDTPVDHSKSEAINQSWMSNGEMKNILDHVDYSRADAILESCWGSWSSPCTQRRGSTADTIAALLGDDFGAISQNDSSTWGFSSCSWNNMPAACQISEIP